MQIIINGKPTDLQRNLSVEELLRDLGYQDKFVAVAVNSQCILRRNYESHLIQAADEIEILAPMAGG